jgi:hypothetical protein
MLISPVCESGCEFISSVVDQLLACGGWRERVTTLIIIVQGQQSFIDPAVFGPLP